MRMTNAEIIQLLKDLRWRQRRVGHALHDMECQGCDASYPIPNHGEVPKHRKNCRIAQAITSLRKQGSDSKRADERRKIQGLVDRVRKNIKRAQSH